MPKMTFAVASSRFFFRAHPSTMTPFFYTTLVLVSPEIPSTYFIYTLYILAGFIITTILFVIVRQKQQTSKTKKSPKNITRNPCKHKKIVVVS